MSYESAPELTAFFKRMGVPLEVVDEPACGKFVKATSDIYPDVVEAGKPNAGAQLETAALFEESGIASWPTSELLSALESNYNILMDKGKINAESEALLGFCNETLALCFGSGMKSTSVCATLVPDALFGVDEEATGIVATSETSGCASPATTTPFLYGTPESQQSDVIAAAILGPRGALRSLRKFHADLEKKSASLEQQMIPISVESIARAISTTVVRFLRTLERSVKAQFKATHASTPMDKKLVILRELFALVEVSNNESAAVSSSSAVATVEALVAAPKVPGAALDEKEKKKSLPQKTPNPFVSNLFEMSVRPFNRLVEPPEGSEFEASVKTKEWCRTIRNAIQQNISDVVKSFSAALICEMAAPPAVQPAVAASYGLQLSTSANPSFVQNTTSLTQKDKDANKQLAALLAATPATSPSSFFKTLTLKCPLNPLATAKPIVPVEKLAPLLEWVPLVVQGWLNDSTIITLLGQMTINAQALTAVAAADADGTVPTSTSNAALEVVQILRPEANNSENADQSDNDVLIVTKSNVHQRVPIFGAALFTLQSCFNHSCCPNAEVAPTLPFGLGGHDIVVQAIPKNKRISSKGKIGGGDNDNENDDDADEEAATSETKEKTTDKKKDKKASSKKDKVKPVIKEGEEVNITYIPMLYLALEDYNDRRARLESYFFVCECKRCFRENAKAEKAEAKKKTKEAKHQKNAE